MIGKHTLLSSLVVLTSMVLCCGCATRIPYQGDTARLRNALETLLTYPISPKFPEDDLNEVINIPVIAGNHLPSRRDTVDLNAVIAAPIRGLEQLPQFNHQGIIWLSSNYSLWLVKSDETRLVYAIKRDASGIFWNEGQVTIRVTGTEAIVSGGNDQVIGYIRFTIEHMKSTPPTLADPGIP